MDPLIIGGGLKLLGGLLGKKAPTPKQNLMSHWAGIMKVSEKFGINPLTVAGSAGGPAVGVAPPNYIGEAISDVGMMYAEEKLADKAELKALTETQMENEKLRDRLTRATLRPQTAGIYAGQPTYVPTAAAAVGPAGARPDVINADGYVVQQKTAAVSSSDDASKPPNLPIKFLGFDILPSGRNADAEAYEGRFGDIGGEILGVPAMVDELAWNVRTRAIEPPRNRRWKKKLLDGYDRARPDRAYDAGRGSEIGLRYQFPYKPREW